MSDLRGQSILVTGAGSGIGAAIALELAGRGARVAVTDLDKDNAMATAAAIGGGSDAVWAGTLDVTEDPSTIEAVAIEAEAVIGPLTGWVSNAGISTMRRFEEISLRDWDETMAVNARAVFACGQVAARRVRRPGGAIVNLASMAGKQGRVPFLAHYVASKFAVVGLTQAMAYELGPVGVRVNCVCPGFVATPMQDREVVWEAELSGSTPTAVQQGWIDTTPLGRLESPTDVAVTVAFLLSDDARFITGEALAVNGGAYMD